ncbi:hypothetical protein [Pelagibacterium sediminicola]|uniref:hypothetical protein n=1 Tax=Pelagibacterium sediminicola TaxID=2248761 RepID=UPI000E31E20E|nr:hypothetical protein [Pelagibacterium sediminicola]
MAQIGFKKMNWLPRPSVWKEAELARLKRKEMMEDFQQRSLNLANAFANTFSFQLNSSVDNVAKTASDRMAAEVETKATEMQNKLMSTIDKMA